MKFQQLPSRDSSDTKDSQHGFENFLREDFMDYVVKFRRFIVDRSLGLIWLFLNDRMLSEMTVICGKDRQV